MARGALVVARTRGQSMAFAVPATWADEAVRPAQRFERGEALRLGAVGIVEGRLAETFLELNGVACRGGVPAKSLM